MASAWIVPANQAGKQPYNDDMSSFRYIGENSLNSVQPAQQQALRDAGAVVKSDPPSSSRGDSEFQMLEKMGPTRNPDQERRFQEMLKAIDSQPRGLTDEENRAYDSILNSLTTDQTLLGQQRDTNILDLETQLTNAGISLDNTKKQREQGFANDNASLMKALRDAEDLLVRNKNANDQIARALYGRGSSAGGAVTEIGQQEYYRQLGELGSKNQTELGKIIQEQATFNNWYDDQKRENARLLMTGKQKILDQFNQDWNNINKLKADVGLSKAQAERNAYESYMARRQQLENTILEHDLALDAMRQEMQENLKYNLALQGKSNYNLDYSGYKVAEPTTVRQVTNASKPFSIIGNPYAKPDDLQDINPYYA